MPRKATEQTQQCLRRLCVCLPALAVFIASFFENLVQMSGKRSLQNVKIITVSAKCQDDHFIWSNVARLRSYIITTVVFVVKCVES